jgi:DNA-binding IclR family transcriptional regulator
MSPLDDAAAQHVVRTLRALESLSDGPQTQARVARRLGIHRRTARRLLARLVDEGYAEADRRGRHVVYLPTPRLAVLGRRVADGLDILAIGRRYVAGLDPTIAAAAFLAILEDGVVRLAMVQQLAEGTATPGAAAGSLPLHATAPGKVFLSADDALLGQVLNQELLAFTTNTLVTRADLLLELAAVRAQRYATEDAEHRPGMRSAASGVVNHVGRTVAAIGALPAADVRLEDLGSVVRAAARAFSSEIGAPGETSD